MPESRPSARARASRMIRACSTVERLENRLFLAAQQTAPGFTSRPQAAVKLFIDFDSDVQNPPGGSGQGYGAFDLNGDRSTFTAQEVDAIHEIWARVAEHFSPFNVDVTTIEPGNRTAKQTAVIGVSRDVNDNPGGSAPINGFQVGAWGRVFISATAQTFRNMADGISHEMGHLLGLTHQSRYVNGILDPSDGYHPGDAERAPIMGNTYSSLFSRPLWYLGPTPAGPTSSQDDLAVIARTANGFGYRVDDHSGTLSAATSLTVKPSTTVSGVITNTSDVDLFKVEPSVDGQLSIILRPAQHNGTAIGMLDARLRVLNFLGHEIARVDSSGSIFGQDEVYTLNVVQQPYYIEVSSHGSYGDVGQYRVSAHLGANLGAGQPDPTFSDFDGRGTLDWGGAGDEDYDVARDVVIQPDGKIVVVGNVGDLGNGYDFGIFRFNSDGTRDDSFGFQGGVRVDFDTSTDIARTVVLLPDGDIFVAGEIFYRPQNAYNMGFARLSSTGALEGIGSYDFGITTDGDDGAFDAALDANGKIVVAGYANGGGIDEYRSQIGLMRLDPQTLALDQTFGFYGQRTFNIGTTREEAVSLAIQPGGSIVVAGRSESSNSSVTDDGNWVLARVTASGELDLSNFGTNGGRIIDFNGRDDTARQVVALPDGRFLVGGWLTGSTGSTGRNFVVARFNANGSTDVSYGSGTGMRVFDSGSGTDDFAMALALQSDGKAILAGGTNNADFGGYDTGLFRATANGSAADVTFGPYGNGLSIIDHAHLLYDQTNAAVLDGDGRVVFVGQLNNYGANYDFTIGRSLPGQYNFRGSAFTVGQVIQAEDYDNGGPGVAYHDATPNRNESAGTGSFFSGHRPGSGVDIERGGGLTYVAYTTTGEWLEYTVDIPSAGTYDLQFSFAAPGDGARFHVEVDGMPATGLIAVPNTGSFLSFAPVGVRGVQLPGGRHTLRIAFDNDVTGGTGGLAANLDWFRFGDFTANDPTAAVLLRDTSPQQVRVQFSEALSMTPTAAQFLLRNIDTNATISAAGTPVWDSVARTVTFTLATPLPEGRYRAELAHGSYADAGGYLGLAWTSNTFSFRFGDANADGDVDFDDLLVLSQNYGQSGRTFSQGNFDYSADGLVSFDDLLLLAQRYGTNPFSNRSIEVATPQAKAKTRRTAVAEVM